ncbi:MAG: hypothetical protein PHQ00_00160 [Phycisphaerae bacterium]|nr:hypothetical protein [Phycisphaerae bacterium]
MQGVCRNRRSFTNIPRLDFRAPFPLLITLFLIQLIQPALNSGDAQATIYWSNSSGTADGFSWTNGGSDKGLFDDPISIAGNTFVFSPTDFFAESINGKSAITSDRLQIRISADPGKAIKGIRITEYGDYDIDSAGKVIAGGYVILTNLTQYETISSTFLMDPDMPIASTVKCSGNWDGGILLEGFEWTNLQIVLNNNLTAKSSYGSQSYIEKTFVKIEIIVPEPATLLILAIGTAILPLCSRKQHR